MKLFRKRQLPLLILITVLGCNKPDDMTVFLGVDTAHNLKIDDPIFFKGVEVGKLKDINVKKGEVTLVLSLIKSNEIPRNSTFMVESRDILGNQILTITIDSLNTGSYFQNLDSLTVDLVKSKSVVNQFLDDIKPVLEKELDSLSQD